MSSPIHSVKQSPKKRDKISKHHRDSTHSTGLVKNLLNKISISTKNKVINNDKKNITKDVNNDNTRSGIFSPQLNIEANKFLSKQEVNPTLNSPLAKYGIYSDIKDIDCDCNEAVKHVAKLVWDNAKHDTDAFLFMKYAPMVDYNIYKIKNILPKKDLNDNKEYTLLLDLDETLVHCSVEPLKTYDIKFPVLFNGDEYNIFMRKRPYFKEFLEEVSKLFEVVVFTASQQAYADTLLDIVDPNKKYIKYRLFRTECMPVEGNFVKNLKVLGRDLSKTIIIDNSPPAFTYQIDNGIPIESWFENKNDKELLYMIPILKKLLTVKDVRPYIKKFFKVKKLLRQIDF